jgi:hypothetical protein
MNNQYNNQFINNITSKVCELEPLNEDDLNIIKLLPIEEIIKLIKIMNINIEICCEIILADK